MKDKGTSSSWILDLILTKLKRFASNTGDLADIPCGTGNLSVRAAREGWNVHPYDIKPGLWQGGESLTPGKIDLNGPLPLGDDQFDALVCCEGMEHLENPYMALREFRRVVRSNGIVIISIPNTIDIRQRWRFFRRGYLGHYPPAVPYHINAMGTFLLCHALLAHAYEILDIDSPNPYYGRMLRRIALLFRFDSRAKLPENVSRMLNSDRVLCGRTVVISSRIAKQPVKKPQA